MIKKMIYFVVLFFSIFLNGVSPWNKWNYVGFPKSYATETVTAFMADSPAANFEMGPFARGPMVLYV